MYLNIKVGWLVQHTKNITNKKLGHRQAGEGLTFRGFVQNVKYIKCKRATKTYLCPVCFVLVCSLCFIYFVCLLYMVQTFLRPVLIQDTSKAYYKKGLYYHFMLLSSFLFKNCYMLKCLCILHRSSRNNIIMFVCSSD